MYSFVADFGQLTK